MNGSLTSFMLNPITALTEQVIDNKAQGTKKAKRIVLGIDVHLRGYQVASKEDNQAIGAVHNFGNQSEVWLWIEKLKRGAEQIEVVYEAGPLGYSLYRELSAQGISCRVCAPDSSVQKRRRRKTNAIDARELAGRLFNYLNGNQQALQLVRIPSIEQERRRLKSRQHDQLVKERKRLAAQGNSILLSQGWGSMKNWWRPRIFERLSQVVVPEITELLEVWLELLHRLDEKIQQAKAQQKRSQKGPRPKGLGAGSLEQLESELLDWKRFSNARKIACIAGMVPSEWSTGEGQRLGSITKVGLPAVRRILVEAVWRMKRLQPDYEPFKKWRAALEGKNAASKKKAVVAIARQLIVDLWRLKTGRVSAQELKLVMVGG